MTSHDPADPAGHRLTGIVDVHSHALVDFGNGLDVGTRAPIDRLPPWSPERAIEVMNAHRVAAEIISMPDAATLPDAAQARATARRANEFLARLVADHPARFGALATVPLHSMDAALEEMAYALDVLHLDGEVRALDSLSSNPAAGRSELTGSGPRR